jgi:hypothetical protein
MSVTLSRVACLGMVSCAPPQPILFFMGGSPTYVDQGSQDCMCPGMEIISLDCLCTYQLVSDARLIVSNLDSAAKPF